MSNQILALKYRPKTFNDLVGQESVSKTLSLALQNNQLANVYLFSGLRGSGKTSTARIMAKALVCKNAPTPTPCNECDSCQDANENKNIDIIELDGASNRGIDSIKELIQNAQYKPVGAKYKVFIIDEVHMLTKEAFNSLLKTLEEPPSYLKFILATTDPLSIPATVLSRTQHYRFNKITLSDLKKQFINILNLENASYDDASIEILARNANGSLRDGITLLEQAVLYCKGDLQESMLSDMLGLIKTENIEEIFEYIFENKNLNELIDKLSVFECAQVLDELGIYFRQRLINSDGGFDITFLDEFLQTIIKAKELLKIDTDEVFVLSYALFRMQFVYNKSSSNIAITKTTQTPQQPLQTQDRVENKKEQEQGDKEAKEQSQEQNQTQAQENEAQAVTQTKQENKAIKTEQILQQAIKQEQDSKESPYDINLQKFNKISELIEQKDVSLAKCFRESFSFKSFKNNTLSIYSKASGECKEMLQANYKDCILINIKIQFGNSVDIKFEKITNNNATQEQPQPQAISTQPHQPQPSSQPATKEALMDDDMVKRAMELFQPQSRVQIKDID